VTLSSTGEENDLPEWRVSIRNPEDLEVRLGLVVVDLRPEEFHGHMPWVAVGGVPAKRLEIGAGEETRVDLDGRSPEGAERMGIMQLVAVTSERMEWAELLPLQPPPSPSYDPPPPE
jgi:hypothetical protein